MIKGKKILITGGTGFIGSHLSEMLVRQGNSVTCFDRYNINNNWGWLEDSELSKDINIILGDIRDFDSVHDATAGQDIIFHLAALIGIPYSYKSPLAYIRTNIEGTYNVLESAKLRQTEKIIITSTSETYGTAQTIPIDESHPLVGQSPYSASKASSDHLVFSYVRTFKIPAIVTNCSNNYGPKQHPEKLIPKLIYNILNNKELPIYGDGKNSREWIFVKDHCEALLKVYKNGKSGEFYNIGSNKNLNNIEISKKILNIAKSYLSPGRNVKIKFIKDRPGHDIRYALDSKKILKKIKWKSKTSFDKGIRQTFEWYLNNKKYYKQISKKDIVKRLGIK